MTTPEDLTPGADVYSSDGHKLGELSRIVLRRRDLSPTHIVVDIGFLRAGRGIWEGGLGLEYDRIIPMEALSRASDERIDLALTADEFKRAKDYSVESFEPVPYPNPGVEQDPNLLERFQAIANRVGDPGVYMVQRLNKPLDSVDLKEGTPVWRQHPHEKIGEVEGVIFGTEGTAQAFVLKRGFLLKRDVVLSARYVVELLDDLVRVDLTDDELEGLPEHHG